MRKNKVILKKDEDVTLRDLLSDKKVNLKSEDVKKAFCHDLKRVLEKENVVEIIQEFLNLENDLAKINQKGEAKVPGLDEFYKNLSPVLMRSILDAQKSSSAPEAIQKAIKEALRIALEEELYAWQNSVQ